MHSNKKTLVIIVRSRTPVPFAGQSIQHFRHPVHSTHNLQNLLHCLRTGATFVCPQVKYSTKRAKAADPAPAQSDSFDFFESVKGRSLWNGRLVGGTGVGWVSQFSAHSSSVSSNPSLRARIRNIAIIRSEISLAGTLMRYIRMSQVETVGRKPQSSVSGMLLSLSTPRSHARTHRAPLRGTWESIFSAPITGSGCHTRGCCMPQSLVQPSTNGKSVLF